MKKEFLSAADTAQIIHSALNSFTGTKARMSEKTIKAISNREKLSPRFTLDLFEAVSEYGIVMASLESGGFGIMWTRVLSAAKALTLDAELITKLRNEA